MFHINTGHLTPERTGAVEKQRQQLLNDPKFAHLANKHNPLDFSFQTGTSNCSLCTAAAIITNITGKKTSSGDVSAMLGCPSEDFQLFNRWRKSNGGGALPGQLTPNAIRQQVEGLIYFCAQQTGRSYKLLNGVITGQPLTTALNWMKKRKKHIHFAVYYCDADIAHWVYAHNHKGKVSFYDYQSDTMFGGPGTPTITPVPVCAVAENAPAQPSAEFTVIAFSK